LERKEALRLGRAVISSVDRFIATHQKSKELWERSLRVSRGIHHDARFTLPFPIYTSEISSLSPYEGERDKG